MSDNSISERKKAIAPDLNSHIRHKKCEELRHRVKIEGKCNGVRSVNVTSDNRYLIITFESSIPRIRIVDLQRLEFLPYAYEGHTDSVRLTSIARDNKEFYTASWDGSSRRFEIATGKCSQIISGFGRSPSCFVDRHQRYLFTASYDSDYDLEMKNNGRCWEIPSGEVLWMYKHTNERITLEAVDISFDGSRVYTGSDDGYGYRWALDGGSPELVYFSFKGTVRKIAVSDNFFAAACTDGFVRVHKKLTGEYYMHLKHNEKDVREVRISKDESRLWTATDNGSLSCYNLMTGEMIYKRKLHSRWIWSICLMADDKIVVTGSGDGKVAFVAGETGEILAQLINVPFDNEFLITCPPDNAFPHGFFYTTNKEFIEVEKQVNESQSWEKLESKDPMRTGYIDKYNLKNLVITRLKNNGNYKSLASQYLMHRKLMNQLEGPKVPLRLKG